MTTHAHPRIPKAILAEMIELAYAHDIGPQQLGRMTGYHARHISGFGRELGLTCARGSTRTRPIVTDIPPRLALLVIEYGPRL